MGDEREGGWSLRCVRPSRKRNCDWIHTVPFLSTHNAINHTHTPTRHRYKEAIRTFVLVLDLYFKHLEQLKQQQRALQQQQQQQGNQQPVQLPKNADVRFR